ncbi:MAG: hypothetical protein WD578_13280 [Bacteroidales bacterium]
MIPKLSRIFIIGFIICTSSCNDKVSDDFQTFNLDEGSKQWLYSGNEGDVLYLMDTLKNQISIVLKRERSEYLEATTTTDWFGWSSIIIAEYERISQHFSFNNGMDLYISMSAESQPENCEMQISFDSNTVLNVRIIPNSTKLTRVTIYQPEDENGIRSGSSVINDRINSTLVYYDSLILNNKSYFDVLEFELRDLYRDTDELSVVSFSIAKEVGLLKYSLKNGLSYERVVK